MVVITCLPLFLGKLGGGEIALIIVLVIVFFGAKKIPELMRGAGRGVKEFKDAMNKDYTADQEKENDKSDTEKKE